MRYYIGLIHKEADRDYGVSFADFRGMVTAGTSLDHAQAMAEEALALHVDGLVEDGEALPEPSTLDACDGAARQQGRRCYSCCSENGSTQMHSVKCNAARRYSGTHG